MEDNKKKVLFIANHGMTIFCFRIELINEMLLQGYEVHIACPSDEYALGLREIGAIFHETHINRRKLDPIKELQLIKEYMTIIQDLKPHVVFTYTVKCNIYGGLACQLEHVPYISTITGLGILSTYGVPKRQVAILLYRLGLRKARTVFFHNHRDRVLIEGRNRHKDNYELVNGSGVNLQRFSLQPYPSEDNGIVFVTTGRIMKDKGLRELIGAATVIKERHPDVSFKIVGFYEDDNDRALGEDAADKGIIEHIDFQMDIRPWLASAHALINPSYHEGMSNAILEAQATGRPVLASDIPGCIEGFDDQQTGLSFKPRDTDDLIHAIEKFIRIPHTKKAEMGMGGRQKMEREFDRQAIVCRYINEVPDIKMPILILVNHEITIYNFRLELVERLLADGYEVHLSSPYGKKIQILQNLGVKWHNIDIDRHGLNPLKDLRIIRLYKRLIKTIKPIAVLGYTIKPNIYGAIAAKRTGSPFIANVTGIGNALGRTGLIQEMLILMYRYAFDRTQRVFFQNADNMKYFIDHKMINANAALIPGSGVNLTKNKYTEMTKGDINDKNNPVKFAFISRILIEKGIEEYLAAASIIKEKYPNTEFHVCGFCEREYKGTLNDRVEDGTVFYHGMINDVAGFMEQMHCIVHPTYYPEGLSNVLLEACACGRAIITTDHTGCREVCRDTYNGFLVNEKDVEDLASMIERFINLPFEEKKKMGLNGRKMVEEEYDRQIVVDRYMDEIHICKEAAGT